MSQSLIELFSVVLPWKEQPFLFKIAVKTLLNIFKKMKGFDKLFEHLRLIRGDQDMSIFDRVMHDILPMTINNTWAKVKTTSQNQCQQFVKLVYRIFDPLPASD